MAGWLWAAAAIVMVVALAVLLWYLLIETEGVYLGRGAVAWLYDIYAGRYEGTKEFQPTYEHLLLSQPIMSVIAPHENPLVLDIATGTARLPRALTTHRRFNGQVIGTDISRAMLRQAAAMLAEDLARVDLIHAPAECLPFDDNAFDVVTFIEALEFCQPPENALREAVRVLRPGGLLLLTLRVNVRTMPGRIWPQDRLQAELDALGIERAFFEPWQDEYTKVWGRKTGSAPFIGAKPLEDVLRCPCGGHITDYAPPHFICDCGQQIPVGDDGVVELRRLQRC